MIRIYILYILLSLSTFNSFSQCTSGDCNNGKGVYLYLNGGKYEGSFQNGLENGLGSIVFSSGAKYEGEWLNGKKNGFGKYYYITGEYYEGNFMSGLMHGKGKFKWSNGNNYEGDFQYDEINGKGIYRWINGDRYEGDFSNGLPNGNGKYYYTSGDIFEGVWVNNVRTGWGKLTSINGIVEEGNYENGTLIKSKEAIEQERIAKQKEEEKRLAQIARQKEEETKKKEENDKIAAAIILYTISKAAENQEKSTSVESTNMNQSNYTNQTRNPEWIDVKCKECNREFRFQYWDKYGGWKDRIETKPGFIKCQNCNYGLKWTGKFAGDLKDPIFENCNKYGWECNGWKQCSKCNGKGTIRELH